MSREPPPSGRAIVWVNCATSADGRLAFAGGRPARLSSPEDLVRVQRLRTQVDAILVGVGTVALDDPSLRVHWELLGEPRGKEPTRIVVDASGRTPEGARVLDGSQPTIVAVSAESRRSYPSHVRTIEAGKRTVDLGRLFAELPRFGVRRVLVEGGARILASVARARLFDRWTVYVAPRLIGGSTAPSMLSGPEAADFDATTPLWLTGLDRMGEGYVATYEPAPPMAPNGPP